MAEQFDAIVIGAGQAGPALCARLDKEGLKTALIERKLLGGTCVNNGCIPTKTLVASAHAVHLARRGADYGFAAGEVRVDMPAVKRRKDTVVKHSTDGLQNWLGGLKHLTLVHGQAKFTAPRTLAVNDRVLEAGKVFINVGGRALVPDLPGVREVPFLTNSSMMEVDFLPEHLVIIGGSYIGLEFGQMFRRFGSEVTIFEAGPRLIQHEDEDVSAAVLEILEREGIHVHLNAKQLRVEKRDGEIVVSMDNAHVHGSHLLLAVGRRPNTDGLAVEKAGINLDPRGYIVVDDQLRTNVPGIWALGDCNGRGAFTHTSYNDYEIVAANLLDGDSRKLSDRILAYTLYIDPPLGRAGLTAAAVKNSGRKALVGKRPMTKVARAVEKGE